MPELKTRFEAAVRGVRELKKQPSSHELLELYALYKQATIGDVRGPRPSALDIRARAKYEAWAKAKGVTADKAMERYVALVAILAAE
jgi:diazepam-binding inhibitor (GABA receptor modulator, acyl-CoA-binding protein)